MYKMCRVFEIESGHILSKNEGRCRMPHGHSRKVEVILSAEELDNKDMICDFKVLKIILSDFIDSFDHAIMINTESPHLEYFVENFERVIPVEDQDPTSEVMSKIIYDHLKEELSKGPKGIKYEGLTYFINEGVKLEAVRIYETSATWAEYSEI